MPIFIHMILPANIMNSIAVSAVINSRSLSMLKLMMIITESNTNYPITRRIIGFFNLAKTSFFRYLSQHQNIPEKFDLRVDYKSRTKLDKLCISDIVDLVSQFEIALVETLIFFDDAFQCHPSFFTIFLEQVTYINHNP